ncbi:MAG TPA: ATP-binding protein [Puia sp.]|nr:ATP-binding protein [Puia sp.]
MPLNKLLERQLKKYLPPEFIADERLLRFIQAVDDSYNAYEKDKALADHASRLNEDEYVRINAKLKTEVLGRRQAIRLLNDAIARMDEPDGQENSNPQKEDSLDATLAHLEDQLARRKHMEAELKRLSLVASANENGVVFTQPSGAIFWTNEGFCKMTGFTSQEIIGKTPIEVCKGPLSDREVLRQMVDDFSTGRTFSAEVIHYRKDGTWFWGRATGQSILDDQGRVLQYFALIEDITKEKLAQERINEFERKFRTAFEKIGDNCWELDCLTGETYFSRTAEQWSHRIAPEDRWILEQRQERYKNGETDHDAIEYRLHDQPGEEKWILDRSVVIERTPDGRPLKIIGTHTDITAQKKLEKDLIEARLQAEQFARSKDNFLANMSHEIRTPMNAVLGMAGQLAKTRLDDKQRFYLDTIYSASENLLVILNDILDLTKIKAGKLGLEKIGFRPADVLDRALQVMLHKAQEKGLLLRISFCDPHLAEVFIGDPYRLNQILLNLLSNAIKFTAHGSVELSCKVLEDTPQIQKLSIEVTDTGMGMDESFIENLFDKFTQEYDSVTRKYGGTGLGMSICKELMTLMGGDIRVTSTKGSGTTVQLLIDLEKGSQSDLAARDNTPVDTGTLKDKKVLVVDDNEMNRLVATTILDNYGTIIFQAGNGQEAVDFLRNHSVDVVLMDIQMPVMSGLEASQTIRREISADLPIIALTANAIRGENDKCIAAGMNDYLSKPFEENALIKMISGCITRRPVPDTTKNTPAEQSPTKNQPLYDLHRLEAIGQGNKDFVSKMIQLFIDQVPAVLEELKAAGAKRDFQAIHAKTHTLKPTLHNFSIDILSEPVRELESIALTQTSTDRIDQLVQTISTVIGEVLAKIKRPEPPEPPEPPAH